MKNISVLLFILVCLANMCLAQPIIDDFNDNDKRLWGGDTSRFIINTSRQLQLNDNTARTSFISTSFAPVQTDVEWNVYVRQAFAGSANNYGRIYLLSSEFNFTQPTEGYFLQLGEAGSNDAVELFRQSGSTLVSVCRGPAAAIAAAFTIRIKVTRDGVGLWRVLVDNSGGTDFMEVATGTDLTYTAGQWMGMVCVYTAGNATRFFYDDIYAGPPKPVLPPVVAGPFDLVINEFFPDPSPPVGLPEEEFVEIYNRSNKTFDLNGWKLGDATSLQPMPATTIEPGGYVVVSNSVSLNNSGDVIKLIDNHDVTIDSLSYALSWYQDETRSSGGYTIERLNPEMPSTDPTNWHVSQSEPGGTPGAINSVFGRNPDSKPPLVLNIVRLNDSTLAVKFSELVVVNKDNYRLVGVGIVNDVRFEVSDTTVVVKLVGLVNGADYSLTVSDFVDFAGNAGISTQFDFTFFVPRPVSPKDILITELMADPAPVVQMPEAEYVELFNRSPRPVRLAGWLIEDATTHAALPPIIMMPGSFLLLTSTANAAKFPNAIGVTSFPSLGNPGDRIVLRDANDVAIDSVSYNSTWYHNLEKADGGWSLELIDVNNPCGEGDNWTACEDTNGGTPGQRNSVFATKPDLTAPEVLSVFAMSADTVVIAFNEKLSATLSTNFSVAGRALFKDNGKRDVLFLPDEKLSTGRLYSITITATDCSGNTMIPTAISFSLPEKAQPTDIVINEVLFNPRPNGADFIELYNRSGKFIDLKGWSLSGEIIAAANDILAPHSYRVFTSSVVATEVSYPASVGKPMNEIQMPSLPDDAGTVTLIDQNNVLIDQFSYTDEMHSPIVGDTEGVSVERISPEVSASDLTNWHSANGLSGFATPGYVNSSSLPALGIDSGTVNVVPEVINPSSSVTFSQIFYEFDRSDLVANVSVIDVEGRVIKSIAANETIGATGSFLWDGDCDGGGLAKGGYYMVWFQTFDLEGRVVTYRRRVVVGF